MEQTLDATLTLVAAEDDEEDKHKNHNDSHNDIPDAEFTPCLTRSEVCT